MDKPTTAGLPNACSSCGQKIEKLWYAPNEDVARSGGGICKACLDVVEKKKEIESRARRQVERELDVELRASKSGSESEELSEGKK